VDNIGRALGCLLNGLAAAAISFMVISIVLAVLILTRVL
jgi:hypothetical protein